MPLSLAQNILFHLQITSVCKIISLPVTRKYTDLTFKFGKSQFIPFQDRLIIYEDTYSL